MIEDYNHSCEVVGNEYQLMGEEPLGHLTATVWQDGLGWFIEIFNNEVSGQLDRMYLYEVGSLSEARGKFHQVIEDERDDYTAEYA